MHSFDDPSGARAWCDAQRSSGRSVGFVPTMGALHEGHLELVRRAVRENDCACVSVFVNPLQFDDDSDFARYPRDFERDAERLSAVGCAMAFTGTLEGFFPEVAAGAEIPSEPAGAASEGLEGAFRVGHFDGVATIVRRLFEVVRPTRAYFGEKDFQQTLVVRDVARRIGFPAVVVCPTSRDSDGLARSSRNQRLAAADRVQALALSRALARAQAAFAAGEQRAGALRRLLAEVLAEFTVDVEYADVRDPNNFGQIPDDEDSMECVQALIAANVGGVRLIDNLRLDGPPLVEVPSESQ